MPNDKANLYILAVAFLGVTAAVAVIIFAPDHSGSHLPLIFAFVGGLIVQLQKGKDLDRVGDAIARKADVAAIAAIDASQKMIAVERKIDENTTTTEATHEIVTSSQRGSLIEENKKLSAQIKELSEKLDKMQR